MELIPVILCGTTGSQSYSNPQITQHELPEKYTLIQKNILISAKLSGVQKIITVTNQNIFTRIKKHFNKINLLNQNMSYILEPYQGNTAATVAAAALHIAQFHNEEALLLVLTADNINVAQDAFQHTISFASKVALSGKLVTFGLPFFKTNSKYHEPETQDLTRFLWNPNLFLFKVSTLLQAMKEHCPDILSTTSTCLKHSKFTQEDTSLRHDLNPSQYLTIPEGSINEVVIKKSNKTIVIPCDLNWL